jgi:hypothetical protein
MYHINKIFALAIIILLTGCSIGGEKKIKIFSVEKPREKLDYPMPTALQLEELKFCQTGSGRHRSRAVWSDRQGLPSFI